MPTRRSLRLSAVLTAIVVLAGVLTGVAAPACADNAPIAPTLSVQRIDEHLTLTWDATAGSSADAWYEVEYRNAGSETFSVGTSLTTMDLSGLRDSYSYTFRIRAYNADGMGAWSNDFTFSQLDVPWVSATLTVSGAEHFLLSWDVSTGPAGVMSFDVDVQSAPGQPFVRTSVGSETRSVTVSGKKGELAVVRVRGLSIYGAGEWSEVSAQAVGTPGQVTWVSTWASTGAVGVSWGSPTSNGEAITNYIVTWCTAESVCTTSIEPNTSGATIPASGTMSVTVAAFNKYGAGEASYPVTVSPFVVPSAPLLPPPATQGTTVTPSRTIKTKTPTTTLTSMEETVQVVKKTFLVKAPMLVAGKKSMIAVSGLAANETFSVTLTAGSATATLASGTANKNGVANLIVTVPAGLAAGKYKLAAVSSTTRKGSVTVTVLPSSAKLSVKAKKSGKKVTVTVKKLAPRESVVVTINGKRVSPYGATASAKGVYKLVVTSKGKKVVVVGAAKTRSGSVRVT
jgi:hypothetical protein